MTSSADPTNADRYTRGAQLLHWGIAVLIVGQIFGGLAMHRLPQDSASASFAFELHVSFGLTILVLSLVRLFWRLTHRPPALPPGTARWDRLFARTTQALFYILMIGVPLIGWSLISSGAEASPADIFFVLPVFSLPVPGGEGTASALSELHELGAAAILGLLILHVAGALKHHYADGDNVLARMVPGMKP